MQFRSWSCICIHPCSRLFKILYIGEDFTPSIKQTQLWNYIWKTSGKDTPEVLVSKETTTNKSIINLFRRQMSFASPWSILRAKNTKTLRWPILITECQQNPHKWDWSPSLNYHFQIRHIAKLYAPGSSSTYFQTRKVHYSIHIQFFALLHLLNS